MEVSLTDDCLRWGNYPTRVSMDECLTSHTWLYLCVMLRSLMLKRWWWLPWFCICWITYLPWSLASVELHISIDPLHLLSYISPLIPCICWVTYLHWSLASVELHISLDPLIIFPSSIPFSSAEDAKIKRCPICRIPIERNDGCAQMMCKRCKHVFCWYCLASLDVSPTSNLLFFFSHQHDNPTFTTHFNLGRGRYLYRVSQTTGI